MNSRLCRVALVCAVVLACGFVSVAKASQAESAQNGERRLRELIDRSASATSGVIAVHARDFRRFTNPGPRPYSLVLSLTSSQSRCDLCWALRPELELVAGAYEKERFERDESGTPVLDESGDKAKSLKHAVFFLRLDGSANYQFLQELGYKTIPHVIYLPSTRSKKTRSWEKLLKDELSPGSGWTAESLSKMIASRSRVVVSFERPEPPPDYMRIFLAITLGGVAVAFGMSETGRPLVDKYVRAPKLWLVASLVFYGFCVSGGMYNRIRKTQWAHVDQNGQQSIIHPSATTQFEAESYVIAFVILGAAASLIVLNTRARTFKVTGPFIRAALVVISLLMFLIFFGQVRYIYTRKNRGYNFGYLWG